MFLFRTPNIRVSLCQLMLDFLLLCAFSSFNDEYLVPVICKDDFFAAFLASYVSFKFGSAHLFYPDFEECRSEVIDVPFPLSEPGISKVFTYSDFFSEINAHYFFTFFCNEKLFTL